MSARWAPWGLVAAGVALLLLVRNAGAAGRAVGSGAVDFVDGVVVGVGSGMGVPETDAAQCDADLAAGDMWAASFSCPAGRWLSAVVHP